MKESCQKKTLISTPEAEILHCSCGIYHVALENMTLHLSPVQFRKVARVFKLALGMMTVQQKPKAPVARKLFVQSK